MSTKTETFEPLATALAEMFAEERRQLRAVIRRDLLDYKEEVIGLRGERDELRREIEKLKAAS
jgi:hypothetical protein